METNSAFPLNRPYRHYVSLGYFCSVALELERLGLRDASYPMDWCISDFEGVIRAMKAGFSDLLKEENLSQSAEFPEHYRNDCYGIHFFHDFNAVSPLSEQLPAVKEKYLRRTARLLRDITEPTLFIRYIENENTDENGKSLELGYIEEHGDEILSFLKSFCAENEILYIANSEVTSDSVKIYAVDKDARDSVCRKPIMGNEQLKAYFEGVSYENREENLKRYKKKKKTYLPLHQAVKKLKNKLARRHPYIHIRRY